MNVIFIECVQSVIINKIRYPTIGYIGNIDYYLCSSAKNAYHHVLYLNLLYTQMSNKKKKIS